MIRRRSFTITWGLLLLLLSSAPALAQEDSVVQRYDLAIENLEFAVASVPGDGVQARDELERAINALLTLSRDTTSASLVQAMERTFERARTAVENQSRTDIGVQAAVLTGGFRRLVMDAAFTAAAGGDLELARARLSHLAADLSFDAGANASLAAAESDTALRLAFEAGTATAISTELTVAERLLASDRDQAYLALATAYGNSLMIQDSPRSDPALNTHLVGAAQALVTGDESAMQASVQEAEAVLSRLANAAVSGIAISAEPPPVAADASVPATAPTTEAATVVPADTGAVGLPEATQPSADQPQAQVATQTPAATAEVAPTAAVEMPTDATALALFAANYEAEQRQARLSALSTALRGAGLAPAAADSNAERLTDAGFSSLAAAAAELNGPAVEAVAAIRGGDTARSLAAIDELAAALTGPVGAVTTAVDPVAADETRRLLADLAARPGLRIHDVTLLASQVDLLTSGLTGGPVADPAPLELAVTDVWSSWLRLGVLVFLGLFAFVPLRLLNIAFGGGNANWRLVAWALFLLLVPVVYEAIAALLSGIAEFADLPWLELLGTWSMFSSSLGQAIWAALVLLALILATIGLRGICIQFGLLGSARNRPGLAGANQAPTLADSPRATKPSAADWDEEF